MPNLEQSAYHFERKPTPFERLALENQDIRLSGHPESSQIVQEFNKLQDPLLCGIDIPSAELFFKLPFNEQTLIAERFITRIQQRRKIHRSKDVFDYRLATDETETQIENEISLLAKPFKLYDKVRIGRADRSIYTLDVPMSQNAATPRIYYTATNMLTGGSEITYFKLKRVTPDGVEELNLLNPNQSVYIFEGNAGNHAQYYRQNVFLNQAPLSLRQLTIMMHESNHLTNEGVNDVNHYLGYSKLKLLMLFRNTPLTSPESQRDIQKILKNQYGQKYLAMLEPLSIAEAVSMYEDEVSASTGASEQMAKVLEFLGSEFQYLQDDVDLLLADSLSTYLEGFRYSIGKSLLPLQYLQLTARDHEKIASIKAELALKIEIARKKLINQAK